MKKVSIDNYDFYPYHNLSRSEWLQIRNSFKLCLGGLDMSVVCEHNEYTTKAKLFDEKLGLIEITFSNKFLAFKNKDYQERGLILAATLRPVYIVRH